MDRLFQLAKDQMEAATVDQEQDLLEMMEEVAEDLVDLDPLIMDLETDLLGLMDLELDQVVQVLDLLVQAEEQALKRTL
jgi:hypothetical protein